MKFENMDPEDRGVVTASLKGRRLRVVFNSGIGRVYDAESGDLVGQHSPFLEATATAKQVRSLLVELGY
jgi:hypothetical protein